MYHLFKAQRRERTKTVGGMDILIFGDGVRQDVQPVRNAIVASLDTIHGLFESCSQGFQSIQLEEQEHSIDHFIHPWGLTFLHSHPRVQQGVERHVHPGVGAIRVRIRAEGLRSI